MVEKIIKEGHNDHFIDFRGKPRKMESFDIELAQTGNSYMVRSWTNLGETFGRQNLEVKLYKNYDEAVADYNKKAEKQKLETISSSSSRGMGSTSTSNT